MTIEQHIPRKLSQALHEIEALKTAETLPQVSISGPIPPANAGSPEPGPAVTDRHAPHEQMIHKDRKQFGGFWLRLGAHSVDLAVLLLPILLVSFLFHAVNAQLDEIQAGLAHVAIAIFIWWTYTAAFLSSPWQATIGKRVCCLKVTDYYGRRITFGRASGRHFASYLSSIAWIGFFMIGWSRQRQGLHDIIAKTLVVKVDC